jgi:hypothetical protein
MVEGGHNGDYCACKHVNLRINHRVFTSLIVIDLPQWIDYLEYHHLELFLDWLNSSPLGETPLTHTCITFIVVSC